jgi:hypothetical protein
MDAANSKGQCCFADARLMDHVSGPAAASASSAADGSGTDSCEKVECLPHSAQRIVQQIGVSKVDNAILIKIRRVWTVGKASLPPLRNEGGNVARGGNDSIVINICIQSVEILGVELRHRVDGSYPVNAAMENFFRDAQLHLGTLDDSVRLAFNRR